MLIDDTEIVLETMPWGVRFRWHNKEKSGYINMYYNHVTGFEFAYTPPGDKEFFLQLITKLINRCEWHSHHVE